MNDCSASIAILGAGPAGVGPLIAAVRQGRHAELLDRGVVWVDRRTTFGAGALGSYDITSDTASDVLLECLAGQERGPFGALIDHPATAEVRKFRGGPLPLPVAARYLAALGEPLRRKVNEHPKSAFLCGCSVRRVVAQGDGFTIELEREGLPLTLAAKRVLFALGGRQPREKVLSAEIAPGLRLDGGWAAKCVMTSALVTARGQERLRARLQGIDEPRAVVIGGSHSAITAAARILLDRTRVKWSDGSIAVRYRRAPKVFYPTEEAARADGYRDWTAEDVCPITSRVFRLSGLRLAARDLVRSVWGLGGLPRERRVSLERFDPEADGDTLRRELARADVIVPAFGYEPATVPVFRAGERLTLLSETRYRAPLVDRQCRVLLAPSTPLEGAYAIGLASGFVPDGDLGGEPSFRGQTNGLWLYQNGVGERVLASLVNAPACRPS